MGSTQEERARRIVGAILLELDKQTQDDPLRIEVGRYPDSMGMLYVDGTMDLYALADAIIKEVDDGPRTVLDTGNSRLTADRVPADIPNPEMTPWHTDSYMYGPLMQDGHYMSNSWMVR